MSYQQLWALGEEADEVPNLWAINNGSDLRRGRRLLACFLRNGNCEVVDMTVGCS